MTDLNEASVPDHEPADVARKVSRLATRARLAIFWERAWGPVALVLALGALFLIVSWLGLWLELPRWGRMAGLGLFSVALAAGLANLWLHATAPSRSAGLARVDRDSGKAHRPATTLEDRLANPAADPATRALWDLHMRRAAKAADGLKVAAPAPRLMDRDRLALRAAVLCSLAAALFVAGVEWRSRLAAAFDWAGEAAVADSFRLDAWIDPPAYTGKPPVIVQLKAGGEAGKAGAPDYVAPVNSVLIVRAAGSASLEFAAKGDLTALAPAPQKPARSGAAAETGALEKRWVLRGHGSLVVTNNGAVVATIPVSTIADTPPAIALAEPVKPNLRGSFTLSYKLDDDYGIASAEAFFDRPRLNGKPVAGRTLAAPPRVPLRLAQGLGGRGDAQTTAELAEHPWAGAAVTMTLFAHDDGANEGRSEAIEITLPQRSFVKPVARALVEQRRNLILSPDDSKSRVMNALEALMIAPDTFKTPAAEYLGLSVARDRLKAAKTDADLLALADFLWDMALQIEEGDVAQSERDLRAAQQALREAMQRGASDEEIRRLTENLKQALDKYMAELSEKQQREQASEPEPQKDRQARNNAGKRVTQKDLQALMDRMQEAQKNGDKAEAQRALDELQNILENLRTAKKRNQQKNEARQQGEKALSELDQMTREQQELRDKTFQQGKKKDDKKQKNQQAKKGKKPEGKPESNGQTAPKDDEQNPMDEQLGDDEDQNEDNDQAGSQEMRSLQDRQGALRQKLQEAKKKMKQLGLQPDKSLDDAEDAMNDAETQLGKGDNGQAGDAQGRAIQGLRQGAQGMEQQMAQQGQGEGEGDTDDEGNADDQASDGKPRKGNGDKRTDPLDRPTATSKDRDRGGTLSGGAGAAQRAQRVLEELRKRVGEPLRPLEELEYLERLLRRF